MYGHTFVWGNFKIKYIWQLRLEEGSCKEKFDAGKQWAPVRIWRDDDGHEPQPDASGSARRELPAMRQMFYIIVVQSNNHMSHNLILMGINLNSINLHMFGSHMGPYNFRPVVCYLLQGMQPRPHVDANTVRSCQNSERWSCKIVHYHCFIVVSHWLRGNLLWQQQKSNSYKPWMASSKELLDKHYLRLRVTSWDSNFFFSFWKLILFLII